MQDHVLAAVSLGCGRGVSPDGKGRLIGAHGHSLPARAKTAKEISHGLTPGAMALVSRRGAEACLPAGSPPVCLASARPVRVAQAQVRADAERAMARSQAANKSCAAAAARNSVANPAAFGEKEPPMRVTAPRPARTMPMAVRAPAQARRWRYSHGAMRRCMPDRGGVPQRHQVVVGLEAVLSFCAFIGNFPSAVVSAIRPPSKMISL